MDALLLLAPSTDSIGYAGRGDFAMAPDGRLRARAEREVAPFVYAGVAILSPSLFKDAPDGAFSLTTCSTGRRKPSASSACALTACGCMSARPTRSRWRKTRFLRARSDAAFFFGARVRIAPYDRRMAAPPPHVFTIPASVPFLPALIKALLDGRLVDGFPQKGDPLSLATATLYLPTRRACRLARDVFLDVLGQDAAILPRIAAIGDIDEDEIVFAESATGGSRRRRSTCRPR